MTIATILSLGETALKLGLICSLTVLALFLSYSMLNVCDLSTMAVLHWEQQWEQQWQSADILFINFCSYGCRYMLGLCDSHTSDKAGC